jgi:hypothetical protein
MDKESLKVNVIKACIPIFYLIPLALLAFIYINFFGPEKEVLEVTGERVMITECLYPLKAVVNKNTLILEPSQMVYHQRAVWGDETIAVPFTEIKTITFKKGLHFFSMRLHAEGAFAGSYSIYYKDPSTDSALRTRLSIIAPDIEVVEKSSLLGGMETFVNRLLN